jgi:hypothetical protein
VWCLVRYRAASNIRMRASKPYFEHIRLRQVLLYVRFNDDRVAILGCFGYRSEISPF